MADPNDKANRLKKILSPPDNRVMLIVYGTEILEKEVKASGRTGRVYLPPTWIGRQVKIIRMD